MLIECLSFGTVQNVTSCACKIFSGFHERPPSANVYREDTIFTENGAPRVFPNVGQTITVKPGRSPDTFSVIVLATGMKTELLKMKVDTSGRVYGPNEEVEVAPGTRFVGSLFQEKVRQRAQSASARREHYLQEVAEGVAGVAPDPEDFPPKKVCRGAKVHTSVELDSLKEECAQLPCWKSADGDVEVLRGSKVYANGAVLNHLKGDFNADPIRLFKEILKLCTGDLASKKGICATEGGAKHRGKVQFPSAVVSAAYGYCTVNCTVPVNFEPTYILRTFLYKRQYQKEKSSATQGPSAQGEVQQKKHQLPTAEDEFFNFGPNAPSATLVGMDGSETAQHSLCPL